MNINNLSIKLYLLRLKTFCKSLLFHIAAGQPKATLSQIRQRLDICMSCDRMNKVTNECMECGCNLSAKSQFLNKLAWADQECPLKKWRKINVNN